MRSGSTPKRRRRVSCAQAQRASAALAARQAVLVAGACSALQGVAQAQVSTTSVPIGATIGSGCIVPGTPVSMNFGAFGVFTPASRPSALTLTTVSTNATAAVTCINGSIANFWISNDQVTLTGAASAAHTLVARIYSDGGYSTLFPTVSPGLTITGSGLASSIVIYGKIATAASVRADTYSGSAILTLSY